METVACDTYLIERGEIGGSILINVFGLVAENFSHEIVEDVRELSWDGELLNILAGHLCFLMFTNLNYHFII